jgi:lipopolysaccharide biosynthesis protein
LILYAYYETLDTRPNLEFFVSHALHAHAKFVFILNGETDAEALLPTNESNIHYIKRNNTCFDLGAYAEVLKSNNSALIRQHKHFIMINASLRGPFIPFWSRDCWSNAYLDKLTDEVKLVGMTMNCRGDLPRHVQSMILATDSLGLTALLTPDGIDNCPQDMNQAVYFETKLTSLIKANGYRVSVMMAMGNSYEGWVDDCAQGDVTVSGAYDGTNIHPYETMFVKTKRGADPKTLELLTKWHDGSNYSSYDYC